jgi:hypothetical protein
MTKLKETALAMRKYDNSQRVVDECNGCERAFVHESVADKHGQMVLTQKCLAYIYPAVKWPGKEAYATHIVTIRTPMKPIVKELPITPKFCPLATHYTRDEIINTSDKVRFGQQKQR